MPKKKTTIYFAASLFNGRETLFNIILASKLERRGYLVRLPQRDGYEFANLDAALRKKLPRAEVAQARQTIIYLLDIGIFIAQSDIVVANLDEPLDPGVDIELCCGRATGKLIVGFRTDVRAPFGSFAEPLRGTHLFPVNQCHVFIRHLMRGKSLENAIEEINVLSEKICSVIEDRIKKRRRMYPYRLPHQFATVFRDANILFKGITDIHSPEGLSKIVERYLWAQTLICRSFPTIV